jgi:IS5 family transposase
MEHGKQASAGLRFDALIMFKTLVRQRLYHVFGAQTEFMIRDRLSFMRFVGVDLHETIPDEKTIWRFREERIARRVMDQRWKAIDDELKRLGESEETAEEPNPHQERQIDGNARSTMKRKRWHFSYKNRMTVDAGTKRLGRTVPSATNATKAFDIGWRMDSATRTSGKTTP